MLDDILALFRRRRALVRRQSPAGNGRWPIELETMGGPIRRVRADRMPRTEPRPAAQPKQWPAPQPDPRLAPPPDRPPQEPRQEQPRQEPARQEKPRQEQRAEPRPQRSDGAARKVPAKTGSLATQDANAARHVAEHGQYLAAHAVEKTFGTRKVVKGASLYVRRGEAVGLLGPNGAGKTTIFYMITGLIKADGGRIELDGYDVTVLPMYQRARLGIGYLPQEASIFRGLNVEENIRAVLEVVEPSRRKREQELTSLLE